MKRTGDNTKFVYIPKREQKAKFVYKELNKIFRLPWLPSRTSENHHILPPSFNHTEKGENNMCQIASQPCITKVKRLTFVSTPFFPYTGRGCGLMLKKSYPL
jgi:hypothetical protein